MICSARFCKRETNKVIRKRYGWIIRKAPACFWHYSRIKQKLEAEVKQQRQENDFNTLYTPKVAK